MRHFCWYTGLISRIMVWNHLGGSHGPQVDPWSQVGNLNKQLKPNVLGIVYVHVGLKKASATVKPLGFYMWDNGSWSWNLIGWGDLQVLLLIKVNDMAWLNRSRRNKLKGWHGVENLLMMPCFLWYLHWHHQQSPQGRGYAVAYSRIWAFCRNSNRQPIIVVTFLLFLTAWQQ